MKSYKDKVIVITGSATGIGKSLAKQFGKEGAKIILCGRRADRVNEAVEDLKALGIEAAGTPCDVTKREDVEALSAFAIETFGKVDVIVNNAGVAQGLQPIIDMDLDDFRKVHEINIYGVLHGIQVFGKLFREQGTPAAIYNLGSENSIFTAVPSMHAYVSSKHAILAITELLAEEVPDNIEVALIMPGYVASEMTEGAFPGMPTDDYTAKVLEQLKAGEFYIVSHAFNKVRMDDRHAKLSSAFDKYAPRYEGDDEYDVRTQYLKMMAAQNKN